MALAEPPLPVQVSVKLDAPVEVGDSDAVPLVACVPLTPPVDAGYFVLPSEWSVDDGRGFDCRLAMERDRAAHFDSGDQEWRIFVTPDATTYGLTQVGKRYGCRSSEPYECR